MVVNIFNSPELIQEFTRVYLAILYSIVALFYTVRIITLKRATGQERVFHGAFLSPNWWHHKIFDVFRVTIWMVCVARWWHPSMDAYLGVFSVMSSPWCLLLGNIMLTLGFIWTIAMHFLLGRHWTSGINQTGPTQLVTKGMYRFSRNPIYLGVLLSQFGFVLALPSWFSLLCFGIGVVTILRQTREEELHLAQRFPHDYAAYQAQVPRWL